MTSWYRVNLKLGKTLEVNFRSQPRQGGVREVVLNQNTHEHGQSVTCNHIPHFYSTTLSHTANCCGSDKLT